MSSLTTSHNRINQKASTLSASFFCCNSIKYDLKLIKIRKIKYDINKIEVKIKKINKNATKHLTNDIYINIIKV